MAAAVHRRTVWRLLLWSAILLAVLLWWQSSRDRGTLVAVEHQPVGIMGTSSKIVAVIPRAELPRAREILGAAEDELRRLESLLSTWIDASEMSRLNAAPAGETVPLSAEVLTVLWRAREIHEATDGAFDSTVGPLVDRWRQAGADGVLPSGDELRHLRESSSWADLELEEHGAVKRRAALRVDVDGVAKGYAIDRALAALERAGAAGGLVEVGGDLRVSGFAPGGGSWPIGLRSPFADEIAGLIELSDGAVCTSGGYARFVEVDGRTFSHILDPRTGWPAAGTASATVVAADTVTADAWATALTVLGPPGLTLLPAGAGIEALVVVESGDGARAVATAGFPPFLAPPPFPVERGG